MGRHPLDEIMGVPLPVAAGEVPAFDDFLTERRRLIALRIREWFEVLS